MAFTNVWDDTFPADTQLANQLGLDLRNFRLDTQQRMAAISGLDASKPNFAGDAQPGNWNGILFFATDTGKIYQFNNPSWTDITANIVGASRTNKAFTSSGSTNAVGQTLFDLSVPAGVLTAGSLIRMIGVVNNGATSMNINVGGNTVVISNNTFTVDVQIINNTHYVMTVRYGSAGAVNQTSLNTVCLDVSTNPFQMTVTQSSAGSITNTSATRIVYI